MRDEMNGQGGEGAGRWEGEAWTWGEAQMEDESCDEWQPGTWAEPRTGLGTDRDTGRSSPMLICRKLLIKPSQSYEDMCCYDLTEALLKRENQITLKLRLNSTSGEWLIVPLDSQTVGRVLELGCAPWPRLCQVKSSLGLEKIWPRLWYTKCGPDCYHRLVLHLLFGTTSSHLYCPYLANMIYLMR